MRSIILVLPNFLSHKPGAEQNVKRDMIHKTLCIKVFESETKVLLIHCPLHFCVFKLFVLTVQWCSTITSYLLNQWFFHRLRVVWLFNRSWGSISFLSELRYPFMSAAMPFSLYLIQKILWTLAVSLELSSHVFFPPFAQCCQGFVFYFF